MALSKDVEAALSTYKQLSARLANVLNKRYGASIPADKLTCVPLQRLVSRLEALVLSFRKDAERPPPALWNVGGYPVELFMLSDCLASLESQLETLSTLDVNMLGIAVEGESADAIATDFAQQQQLVINWFKDLMMPRKRRNQDRDQRMVGLKSEGKTWPEIGDDIGIDPTVAKQAMQRLPKELRPPKGKPGRPKKKT